MWVQRTPEEIAKWHEATAREALSHGRFIAGMVWILVSVLLAGGWFVSIRAGFAAQQSTSGSFWLRLPIVAAVALPFAWFVFRYESKKELAELKRRTICPRCDTAGEGNTGGPCPCGGTAVLQSTMKWIEDERV